MMPAARAVFLVAASIVLLTFSSCRPDPSPPPGSRRIVVLAVDGAGWDQLSPLLRKGSLPHLARLFRAGAAGRLVSVEPLLPAALYTSIATGQPRAAHGILGEAVRSPDGYGLRPVTADRRRAPPVWSIASSRGLAVGVAGWPATFPVDRIDGYMLSDMFAPSQAGGPGFIHPPGAFGQGNDPAARVILPESVEAVAALDPGLRRRFEADLRSLERGLALYRVYQPRLALFRLEAIDYASHRFWQYHQPRYLELARSRGLSVDDGRAAGLAGAVEGSYRFVDECVGRLLDKLPIDATLLILSPYSLRGVGLTDYLHLDVDGLLERLGYLAHKGDGTIDWHGTAAFSEAGAAGSARGVYINRRGREAEGIVDPDRADRTIREVASALAALRTEDGDPLLRSATPSGGLSPEDTPDIVLVENLDLNPMATIRVGEQEVTARELFRRFSEDFSIHQPEGILLAAGEGIRPATSGVEADLHDVLPTLLRLLGLPGSSALPGSVLEEILDPPAAPAEARPESYADAPSSPEPVFLPEAVSDAWLEKLRETGHFASHRR